MATVSDNQYPKLILTPTDPATLTVPSGDQALVLDSTNSDTLSRVDDAGTVTPVDSGGGGGTTDTWHNVSSFTNSWVNYGSPEAVAAYMIDGSGNVHLRGTIKSGTIGNFAAFTLPTGYRPSAVMHIATLTNNGGGTTVLGEIRVDTTGAVAINIGSNGYVRLDTATFPIT